MDESGFARLIDIVGEAMERAPAARDGFLASACGADRDLLEKARELVEEAETTSLAHVTARLEDIVARAAGTVVDPEAVHPSRIGPYEIVRSLGRGGMGVVYMGRQEQPLKREVAIKVVRRSLVTPDALARFRAERQTLALMQHPNIATVLDAGTTDDDLPYFVMELVEGLPITEYCDRHRLDLDERIELFDQVCRAVHHAHQRGVIHRDLKPSNILVVASDGRPAPKVIDFGIAKAIQGTLTDESFHTGLGAPVGTLDYMSPEQVRGSSEGIDTRADVYALGVILYELVAGRHPFADTPLRGAGLLEAQRIILESDPPRPSATTAGSGRASGRGRIDADRRRVSWRRVRGELDWVVMKALEKDRERRYASALDLARDLERYARDQPVSAGPPSLAYRTRKFVRRHRAWVTAAALIVLALVSGTVLAGAGFVRATAEATRAQAISDFLSDMLASVRPDEQGRAVTVREVLDEARTRLEAGDFSRDPETEATLALVMGHSYEGLGRFDEAIDLLRRSVDLRVREHGREDRRVYDSMYRLGTALWKRGDLEEALTLRLEIADMTEAMFGTGHPEHAESLSNLGNTYADMVELEPAVVYLERAVEVGRRLPGEEGELDLARFLNNLGTVYFDMEDFEASERMFQESLEIRRRLLGEDNDVYAITLGNLGDVQRSLGDHTTAERTLRRAVALDERIFGPSHPRTASTYSALATALVRLDRLGEAESLLRQGLEIRMATSGDNYWRVADERRKLAEVLSATDRPEEALEQLHTAWDGLVERGTETTAWGRDVASAMERLYARTGDDELAAAWAARSEEPER